MTQIKVHLHAVGEQPRLFPTLHLAKIFVHENKVTGYIHLAENESSVPQIIRVRKGKREGAKKGTWVPCV
jgi:hypothetical protein